jgi:hypothetical protein
MSWSKTVTGKSPSEAMEEIEADEHIPTSVRDIINKVLKAQDDDGVKLVSIATHGHMPVSDQRFPIGSTFNVTINMIVTEAAPG